jgi:hypothetical protein
MADLRQPDLNTTRQSALNKLVEHAKKIFGKKDSHGCSIVVKPCGAFKEHRNFFAKMEKRVRWDDTCEYHLIVHVDDVLIDNDTCDFHSVFGMNLGSCPDVEMALKHFIWVLEDITFDKKSGRMYPKNHVKSDFDMDHVLSDLWEMEQDLGCCVCHERTDTETKCGHKLCIPCWASNNTTFYAEQGSDDEDAAPKCPMCRADIDCMK